MKLSQISPERPEFKVGELAFDVTNVDIENNSISFSVLDAGGLQVGAFNVDFDDVNDMDYVDALGFQGTLERLRKSGDSNKISRNINRLVRSVMNKR